MSVTSLRQVARDCLNKSGPLSVKRDFMGVYQESGYYYDRHRVRSLRRRLDLMGSKPFIRIALVIVVGSPSSEYANHSPARIQEHLDRLNDLYLRECGLWFYCAGSLTVQRDDLVILETIDCLEQSHHQPSAEERQLFDLGRNLGADVVCYYVYDANYQGSSASVASGCAAHPPGRRGVWLKYNLPSAINDNEEAHKLAHELTHLIGYNQHVGDRNNILYEDGAQVEKPNINAAQRTRILADPVVQRCLA